ncbi:uncharacterized protein LOC117000198 [Catharus ustulatus]|uniref:uncharacterized protein LOC117000198 n=1 Tax=Catharus ustulatus TaxID=91951 RepID=UPI00140A177B|nr:uncharacterized protein LOC117000198 [Catharus ustulatus]
MNQMGTIDTWVSCCTPGQRLLQSPSPAWCCPCLIPSFPLPSLLSAPCLAPWGFGEHSRAAWPGMSPVHPLFDLTWERCPSTTSSVCVCPQQPGNVGELRIAPSCRRESSALPLPAGGELSIAPSCRGRGELSIAPPCRGRAQHCPFLQEESSALPFPAGGEESSALPLPAGGELSIAPSCRGRAQHCPFLLSIAPSSRGRAQHCPFLLSIAPSCSALPLPAQHCPFLQEELSLHSWCSWAALTGVFPLSFPLCCVSITENPRLVWGGGTLKLILATPPLWMFQYSSSSSLFPFPVVPVSSFTSNPPFWGLLGKICAEG